MSKRSSLSQRFLRVGRPHPLANWRGREPEDCNRARFGTDRGDSTSKYHDRNDSEQKMACIPLDTQCEHHQSTAHHSISPVPAVYLAQTTQLDLRSTSVNIASRIAGS